MDIEIDTNINLRLKGSKIAKDGFKNEIFTVNKFDNWKNDFDAQKWLEKMNYDLKDIEFINAEKVKGSFKSDIVVKIKAYSNQNVENQNLSVKLTSNAQGFNQIDKRFVDKYKDLWKIPDDLVIILKKFTGEIKNQNQEIIRDYRRMFFDEMKKEEKQKVIDFFTQNKNQVISDLLKGRDLNTTDWILVIKKIDNFSSKINWGLVHINEAINYFATGKVEITKKGNLKIGKITMQRKGGDGGRKTANMLQFKFNPNLLIEHKVT